MSDMSPMTPIMTHGGEAPAGDVTRFRTPRSILRKAAYVLWQDVRKNTKTAHISCSDLKTKKNKNVVHYFQLGYYFLNVCMRIIFAITLTLSISYMF